MSKVPVSVVDLARKLRECAETTARTQDDWRYFEGLCADVLMAAYNSGRAQAKG